MTTLIERAAALAATPSDGTVKTGFLRLFGSAVSWPFAHLRLLIDYALLAGVVSLAGAMLYTRIHVAQQDDVIHQLSATITANATTIAAQQKINADQDVAIGQLKGLREKDDRALTGLQSDFAAERTKSASFRSQLRQLEENNARAKALLDTAVPDDTSCVLDHRPCPAPAASDGAHQNRSSDATDRTSAGVLIAAADPNPQSRRHPDQPGACDRRLQRLCLAHVSRCAMVLGFDCLWY